MPKSFDDDSGRGAGKNNRKNPDFDPTVSMRQGRGVRTWQDRLADARERRKEFPDDRDAPEPDAVAQEPKASPVPEKWLVPVATDPDDAGQRNRAIVVVPILALVGAGVAWWSLRPDVEVSDATAALDAGVSDAPAALDTATVGADSATPADATQLDAGPSDVSTALDVAQLPETTGLAAGEAPVITGAIELPNTESDLALLDAPQAGDQSPLRLPEPIQRGLNASVWLGPADGSVLPPVFDPTLPVASRAVGSPSVDPSVGALAGPLLLDSEPGDLDALLASAPIGLPWFGPLAALASPSLGEATGELTLAEASTLPNAPGEAGALGDPETADPAAESVANAQEALPGAAPWLGPLAGISAPNESAELAVEPEQTADAALPSVVGEVLVTPFASDPDLPLLAEVAPPARPVRPGVIDAEAESDSVAEAGSTAPGEGDDAAIEVAEGPGVPAVSEVDDEDADAGLEDGTDLASGSTADVLTTPVTDPADLSAQAAEVTAETDPMPEADPAEAGGSSVTAVAGADPMPPKDPADIAGAAVEVAPVTGPVASVGSLDTEAATGRDVAAAEEAVTAFVPSGPDAPTAVASATALSGSTSVGSVSGPVAGSDDPSGPSAQSSGQSDGSAIASAGLSDLKNIRLRVYAPSSLSNASIAPTLASLTALGVKVRSADRVDFRVRATQVRLYHEADRQGAIKIAEATGARLRDFTDYSPSPPFGTVELWLAGTSLRATTVQSTPLELASAPRRAPFSGFFQWLNEINSQPSTFPAREREDDEGIGPVGGRENNRAAGARDSVSSAEAGGHPGNATAARSDQKDKARAAAQVDTKDNP